MAGIAVAVVGDVKPEPAKDPTGTWKPGLIAYEAYDHLTIDTQSVIYEASCTFIFTPNTNMPPKNSEKVILSAGATVLRGGKTHVLVNGNFDTGEIAHNSTGIDDHNQLKVQTSKNKLRSA
jgi:hypothetical protein